MSRHVPGMVALALAPPIAALGALGIGLAVLERLARWCPCGAPDGCTHGPGRAVTHARTGAVTHSRKRVTAGQTHVEGSTTPDRGRNGPMSTHAAHAPVSAPGKRAGQDDGRGVTH